MELAVGTKHGITQVQRFKTQPQSQDLRGSVITRLLHGEDPVLKYERISRSEYLSLKTKTQRLVHPLSPRTHSHRHNDFFFYTCTHMLFSPNPEQLFLMPLYKHHQTYALILFFVFPTKKVGRSQLKVKREQLAHWSPGLHGETENVNHVQDF